ncbi:MAG: hypothetical protein GY903_04270 [Fuerstiella sp.]|nr:hypothetical protein [Fuerstiella sp.]
MLNRLTRRSRNLAARRIQRTGNQRRRRSFSEQLEDRLLLAVVSSWPAENTSVDSVGSNDGSLVSGASYADGQIGQAFSFDGVDDRVLIPDSLSLQITGSITIEAWVRVDSTPVSGHGLILFRGDDRGGLDPYQLTTSDGRIRFSISSLTSSSTVEAPVPVGEFAYVAATLDDSSGELSLYLNGVLMAQMTTTARPFGALDPASNPSIGIGNHGGYPTTPHNFPFHGLIDELQVHDQALSAADVLANFNAGKGSLQPTLSIGDASVTEGNTTPRFVNDFIDTHAGGLSDPRGIAVGTGGDFFLASSQPAQILRFDGTTGAYEGVFADASAGTDLRTGAVLFNGSFMYVTTAQNDSVLRFDASTGTPAPAAGETGATFVTPGAGGLDRAFGMDFGSDGNLYLTSQVTDNVLRFNGSTGAFIDVFVAAGSNGLDQPNDLIFGNDGNLYVASSGTDEILRFHGPGGTNPGTIMDVFVSAGSGGLDFPPGSGLTFGPAGDLYVSSRGTDQVMRYNGDTGVFLESVAAAVPGSLDAPKGIVFGNDGRLYVVSGGTHQVLRSTVSSDAILTAQLSSPSPVVVTANYDTADASAAAGSDYDAASGTITFQPGVTSKTIVVPTIDNSIVESDETFVVNLSLPSGAVLGDSQGVATIADDDAPPIVELLADSFEQGEWNGVWIEDSQNDWRRTSQRASDGTYAAEIDGRATNATLTLANPIDLTSYNSAELTFSWFIETNWDNNEHITLEFLDGNDWNEIIALKGNVDQENVWHHETITIDGNYLVDDFKLRYRTAVSGSREDGFVDNVRIVGTGAGVSANLTITDVQSTEGDSGTTPFVFTVIRSGDTSGTSTVDFSTADVSADSTSDYAVTNGTLTFNSGEISTTITVLVDGDTSVESDEVFVVNLSNATGATVVDDIGQGTILNDDQSITINDVSETEGEHTPHYRGAFVDGLPGGHFNPLTFGPDGNIYTAVGTGTGYNTIQKFNGTTGAFLGTFMANDAATKINGVRDIVFHPTDGYVYVASAYTDEVLRYDATTGDFFDIFVAANSGGIDHPDGMMFGPDSNADGKPELYVTGWQSHSVVRYDGATGTPLGTYITTGSNGLNSPFSLAFRNDEVYVTSAGTNQVLKYDADNGSYLGVAASTGLDYPRGLTFGPDDLLYVTSGNNDRILRFTPQGTYVDDYVPAGVAGLDDPRTPRFGLDGSLYVTVTGKNEIMRFGDDNEAVFTATLSTASSQTVTVDYTTAPAGTDPASEGDDYQDATGQIVFAPGVTEKTILVPILDDALPEVDETFEVTLSAASGSPAGAVVTDGVGRGTVVDNEVSNQAPTADAGADQTVTDGDDSGSETVTLNGSGSDSDGTIVAYEWKEGAAIFGTTASISPTLDVGTHTLTLTVTDNGGATASDTVVVTVNAPVVSTTKFYVVDSSADETFEYQADGTLEANYNLGSGNNSPKGAAADATGNTVWVIDNDDYVYDADGNLLRSWKATGLDRPEGIASDGTNLWIVDRGSDRVYYFAGGATRTTDAGATSNFPLDTGGGNKAPKGITYGSLDGVPYLWVVNATKNVDKVFRYGISGSKEGNWTIDSTNADPKGITVDPANVDDMWIVDSKTDSVYQYSGASGRTSGNQNADGVFGLAAGNTNAQGIADPPTLGSIPVTASLTVAALGANPSASVNVWVVLDNDEEDDLFAPANSEFTDESPMIASMEDDSTWLDQGFETATDWLSLI